MSYHDANALDRHGYLDSVAHRLDPRAKVVATLVFIVTVVSHGKYEVAAMVPFVTFPAGMAILGFVPARIIGKHLLIASPFILVIGAFNPLLDRTVALELGGVGISGGWVSFASIMTRGYLCIGAAVALVATTSFPRIAEALRSLGAPRALVTQLLLLYRYLFLLIGEARRMNRARALKGGSGKNTLSIAGSMLSSLLMRTMDRGDSIWLAMKTRGFEGEMRTARVMEWRVSDTAFLAGVVGMCALLRAYPVSALVGGMLVNS